ncbi:uncharacterized protein LOC124279539 [Haliotis rubra]|uniref:uncharacterized protein LOC124279539 n=1 Tax=Haliotis rubra TaxID=36100 RepID=UPI001EE506DF|nr:uncharacterized protein LOC124279539 [Haliotis rubra]
MEMREVERRKVERRKVEKREVEKREVEVRQERPTRSRQRSYGERVVVRPTVEGMPVQVVIRPRRRSPPCRRREVEYQPPPPKRPSSTVTRPGLPQGGPWGPKRTKKEEERYPVVWDHLGLPGAGRGRFLEQTRDRRGPHPGPRGVLESAPEQTRDRRGPHPGPRGVLESAPEQTRDRRGPHPGPRGVLESAPEQTRERRGTHPGPRGVLESRGEPRRWRGRGSSCPVEGCGTRTYKLQDHAFFAHLPRYFRARYPQDHPPERDVLDKIVTALRQLASWILGPGATLEGLHEFCNRNVQLSPDCTLQENAIAGLRHLCTAQGWRIPTKFSLRPLNSPACLKQWRVLLHLLNFVPQDKRREFRLLMVSVPQHTRWTARVQAPQEWDQELVDVGQAEAMWLPEDEEVQVGGEDESADMGAVGGSEEVCGEVETWEEELVSEKLGEDESADMGAVGGSEEVCGEVEIWEEELASEGLGEEGTLQGPGGLDHLIDAHFHLDRTWAGTFGRAPQGTTPELLASAPEVSHPFGELPVWGVEVYCDPPTFPQRINNDPRYITAVGIHPKKVAGLTDKVFRQILGFWKDARCLVGEVGLDHSVPAWEWRGQESALKELLPHVPAGRVVIVHVRGPAGDEEAGATHARAIQILKGILPPQQPVHVHCFTGGEETVQEWLKAFPRAYFGFTGRVQGFKSGQVAGLRAVPGDRLLLETDSPYMPPKGYRVNSPALLCLIGDMVAGKRGMSTKELLVATTANAAQLFAL